MADIDISSIYLNELSDDILDAETEKILLEKAQSGNKAAREELIKANLRLVVFIAKKYNSQNASLSFLDLVQEGNIGLMTAIDKYDLSSSYRFSTYAYYWIKSAISRALSQQSENIRVPSHIVEKINRYKKIVTGMMQKYNSFSDEEVAAEMGITLEELKKIKSYMNDMVSLDSPMSEDNEDSFGDFVEDKESEIQERYEEKEMGQKINRVLSTLPDKESDILKMRFGIGYIKPLTLDEIARKIGLSKERVRQVEKCALKKMRNPIRASVLKDYIA